MKLTVAAFFADIPGRPSRFDDYLPFIKASRRALELTNPGARYVVLTDAATAPKIEPHAEAWVANAGDVPLVLRVIRTQALFAAQCKAELLCLPDVDCLANRDLRDAIPADVGLAITHKGKKFHHRIVNLGLARDMDLAAWFLARATSILESWPAEAQEWWGDQEAWGAALGTNINGLGVSNSYIVMERGEGEILIAHPADRTVHVYPAQTHNCPMPDDGNIRPAQRECFMLHFKGERKGHLAKWMVDRFGL